MNPVYHKARFQLSAHELAQLPPDIGCEVAFAGRSNAGKSSVLNALTGRKNLARTSKTPGRTQEINVFPITPERRLIDLPGYGYAKVPASIRDHWQAVLPAYLEQRRSLRGLIVIMDMRHPLTEHDHRMLDWCGHAGLAAHVLLNKADKLKRGPATTTLRQVDAALAKRWPGTTLQLFSAMKGTGIDEAHGALDRWFDWASERTGTSPRA